MSVKKSVFSIIGRYMRGTEVIAYRLIDNNTGEQKRYSKEQVYCLVGAERVTNCSYRFYKEKVLLEDVGVSLSELPVLDIEKGKLKNTDGIGRLKRGEDLENAMSKVICIGVTADKKFILKSTYGSLQTVDKKELFNLVKDGKVGNLKAQYYNDNGVQREIIRRLDGGKMRDLPLISL